MLSECAKPRVLAGTSGLLQQPQAPEPAPPYPENAGQTAVLTPSLSCYSPPPPQNKRALVLHKTMIYVFRGTPICPKVIL